MIKARNVDPNSPLRYSVIEWADALPALTGTLNGNMIGVWKFKQLGMKNAKIVDAIISQSTAGTAGTSWSAAVKKNGNAIFSTAPVLALASGANAVVDVKAECGAVPTGATRPILTTANPAYLLLTKGDILTFDLTVTGTYTGAAPFVSIALIVDPYPV